MRLCNKFLQRAGKTGFFLSQIVSEEEKYPSSFLPKQIFWIIATTPELSLSTIRWILKCANVYKLHGSRSTILFFRSQTGQQHENIFLSPLPFFLPFVFCSKEKHTRCMWNKNYPIYVETLKYTIWDMDGMVGMDGWLNGHPLDSAFKHSTEKCFVIIYRVPPKMSDSAMYKYLPIFFWWSNKMYISFFHNIFDIWMMFKLFVTLRYFEIDIERAVNLIITFSETFF